MRTGKLDIGGGRSIELSKYILGTAELGSIVTPEPLAFDIMDKYYANGGRVLDTARQYQELIPFGSSTSERTIGRWLKRMGRREDMIIITKGACQETREKDISRVERKCIENDICTSLAVMDLDYVDGYLLHKDDESVPVEEIVDVMDEVVKRGLARFVGVSNWRVGRINAANEYARTNGKTPFVVSEIYWNMAKPTPNCTGGSSNIGMTDEDYRGYLENKLPVFAYSSQAIGFFSKYLSGQKLEQPRAQALQSEDNVKRAGRCREICEQYKVSPAAICLAYISSNKVDGYPIFGCSKLKYFDESAEAFDLEIDQKAIDYIIGG